MTVTTTSNARHVLFQLGDGARLPDVAVEEGPDGARDRGLDGAAHGEDVLVELVEGEEEVAGHVEAPAPGRGEGRGGGRGRGEGGGHVGSARASPSRDSGMRTVNVLPVPGRLSTAMSPPWRFTECFTMARPRPVPPLARERALSTR